MNDIWTQVYVGLTEIITKTRRTAKNICISLISPETRFHAEHFPADSIDLSLLIFTQSFSKPTQKNSRRTCAKTQFNVK